MAKAPKVKQGGYEAAKERFEKARQVFRISAIEVSDLDFEVALNSFSVRTRRIVRQAAGEAVEQFLYGHGDVAIDTYANLWWLSRVEAGEGVTLEQAEAEWDERYGHVTLGDISDKQVTDGDSPES